MPTAPQDIVTMDPQPHDTVVVTLDRTVDAPSVARRHIRELAGVLGARRSDDAVLLVSELVTNAVKYGGAGPVEIAVKLPGDRLRVDIRDSGGSGPLPQIREPGERGGGHGLRLVDSIADRWGVEHGSTIVWFELDLG